MWPPAAKPLDPKFQISDCPELSKALIPIRAPLPPFPGKILSLNANRERQYVDWRAWKMQGTVRLCQSDLHQEPKR